MDEHCGWVFRDERDDPVSTSEGHGSFDCTGCVPDPLGCARSVRDLYAEDDTKFSVPVLYDAGTKTIANNESSDILRILNGWPGQQMRTTIDLYPPDDRAEIDRINDFVYSNINNGVYRCGFATTQHAYDEAVSALFAALDKCDRILSKQRWLANTKELSEADIRLFVTLIRFDAVYVVYFKTNVKTIREYEHLREYVLDVLATYPEVARSVDMNHIKRHYFGSHAKLNPYGIVPRGPDAWWDDVVRPSSRSVRLGRRGVAFEVTAV